MNPFLQKKIRNHFSHHSRTSTMNNCCWWQALKAFNHIFCSVSKMKKNLLAQTKLKFKTWLVVFVMSLNAAIIAICLVYSRRFACWGDTRPISVLIIDARRAEGKRRVNDLNSISQRELSIFQRGCINNWLMHRVALFGRGMRWFNLAETSENRVSCKFNWIIHKFPLVVEVLLIKLIVRGFQPHIHNFALLLHGRGCSVEHEGELLYC